MAIKDILWRTGDYIQGFDLHVLRGTSSAPKPSVALDNHLYVIADNDQLATVLSLNSSSPTTPFDDFVSVKFKPRFANNSQQKNSISVDMNTGVVNAVVLSPGSSKINSFIIDVLLLSRNSVPA